MHHIVINEKIILKRANNIRKRENSVMVSYVYNFFLIMESLKKFIRNNMLCHVRKLEAKVNELTRFRIKKMVGAHSINKFFSILVLWNTK